LKKIISYLLVIPMLMASTLFLVSPITQADTPLTCNMQSFTGADDTGYRMDLPFSLDLGSQKYNNIYVTTNGTITFGELDITYWDYPQTPSVSLAGWDWVTWGEGAYVAYGYNSNSFCIEWSVRPYPQSSGPLTQIRLVVNKYANSSWHGEIVTFGWIPDNVRRGIRFERGQDVVTIAAAFDVNGGVPIEVEPAPAPTSFEEPVVTPTPTQSASPDPEPADIEQPSPSPTEQSPEPMPTESVLPYPTPSPEPTQSQQPHPTLTPLPQPTEPSPEPSETFVQPLVPSPTPTPLKSELVVPVSPATQSPTPEPQPLVPSESTLSLAQSPSPDPSPSSTEVPSNNISTQESLQQLFKEYDSFDAIPFEVLKEYKLNYSDLPPNQPVMLENGVILTAEVADALQSFNNIDLFLATLITNPGKLIKAFANVGADMTPEKRKESQIVVISVIIYAQFMNGLSTTNTLRRRF
jgi:hypothetical protein